MLAQTKLQCAGSEADVHRVDLAYAHASAFAYAYTFPYATASASVCI
jgi:hypothetical protein